MQELKNSEYYRELAATSPLNKFIQELIAVIETSANCGKFECSILFPDSLNNNEDEIREYLNSRNFGYAWHADYGYSPEDKPLTYLKVYW